VDYPASRHGMTATDVTVADVPKCWTKLTETATKLGRKCKNVQTFVHVIFRVSYQKKIKSSKRNLISHQKNKLIKKKIIPSYPGLRKPNAKYKHHEICALHHQKNMFKLFFDDLNFFGGSLVKQLLLAEKVY
jgi:hypothetical protein